MRSIGFGLERLGLVAIDHPRRTLAALAAFTLFCVVGLFSLQPEGRLSEIYRGSSQNYADYIKVSKEFPANELDLYMLVSGKDLLSRKHIGDLRAIEEEVTFAEGVEGTLSMFSLRGTPDPRDKALSPPLFPAGDDELDDTAFNNLVKAVRSHPDVVGKLLSVADKDGRETALFIVTLKSDAVKEGTLWGVLENIRSTAEKAAGAEGLEVRLAGMPFFQQEIRNAINRDLVVFNISGILIGVIICIYFIRQPVFVFMTTFGSTLTIVWIFGLLGHFGQSINGFLTIIPPLMLVVTVSDGMHLTLDYYRRLREGEEKVAALRATVLSVGPACVLTSLTTALAMGTLVVTDSAVLATFGLAAAAGTMLGFVAVIMLLPALSMVMIRDERRFRDQGKGDPGAILVGLERLTMRFADVIVPEWKTLIIVGVGLTALFAAMHAKLEPRYRLADEIPDRPALNAVTEFVNQAFGGGDQVNVVVGYGKDRKATSPDVLEATGEVHRLLASRSEINEVSSLEKTRLWFRDNGIDDADVLQRYIADMPDHVRGRFINDEAHAVIVSGKVPDLGTKELRELNARLKADLGSLRDDYPGFTFTVSGMSSLAAVQSTSIISQLNMSLVLAILVIIPLLGFAFRSFDAALISVVPNLFPLFAAGTLLYLTDSGLQYASVLGLTIAFGIAVDDTIHFINRLHQEKAKGISDVERVRNTLGHIGPALMLTTLVILFGLSITMVSDLGVTRVFGQMTMVTLAAALVADLALTPAMSIGISRAHSFLKRGYRVVRTPGRIARRQQVRGEAKPTTAKAA